jgi:hypothetical protein
MNLSIQILIYVSMALVFNTIHAEEKIQTNPKKVKMTNAANESTYYIDGKPVSSKVYQDFISTLLPQQSNYLCKRQVGGGTTSYDLKDKSGNFHHVIDIIKGKTRIFSITPILKENNK